jgi:hypothetical protein
LDSALLQQEGLFFLKDVAGVLQLTSDQVKNAHRGLHAAGRHPYRVMGVRKVWTHWLVRMSVFSAYYRAHLTPAYKAIDRDWDANRLLGQDGRFLLSDVCRLLPFEAHQLRHQAKTNPQSRRDYGVWKDPACGHYLVEMKPFAAWIAALWQAEA